MMVKSSTWLLLAAATAVMAMPAPHEYEVHERRDHVPVSWTDSKKLDGSVMLPVRIGLTQSNLDQGHNLLMEMSVTLYLGTAHLSPSLTLSLLPSGPTRHLASTANT